MTLSAAGLQQVPHLQFSILCPPIIDGDSVKILCCVGSCQHGNTDASSPATQASRWQRSQLQNAASVEMLKDASRAYVILDRDDSNDWLKTVNVGDTFVVLQPWTALAPFHEQPVVVAFVAVPLPNE